MMLDERPPSVIGSGANQERVYPMRTLHRALAASSVLLLAAVTVAAGTSGCGRKAAPGEADGDAGAEGEGEGGGGGGGEGEGEGEGGDPGDGPPADWHREWPDGPSVVGLVEGAAGPLAGAQVTEHTGDKTEETDAQGAFVFDPMDKGHYAFEIRAAGHVTTTRVVDITTDQPYSLWLQVKPDAEAQTVSLPDAGGDPVVVTAFGDQATLTLEAGDLVDGSGNAATGDVDVVITTFDPNDEQDIQRMPADLLTAPATAGADPGVLVTGRSAALGGGGGDGHLEDAGPRGAARADRRQRGRLVHPRRRYRLLEARGQGHLRRSRDDDHRRAAGPRNVHRRTALLTGRPRLRTS